MERAENKALTDVISGKPGESAPATNIVPMITRVDQTIAIAPESLLPPQFSQIDRDREHDVCHEQPYTIAMQKSSRSAFFICSINSPVGRRNAY
jgi:hypothetical protein